MQDEIQKTIIISEKLSKIKISEIIDLYIDNGWVGKQPYSIDKTKKSFLNSTFHFFLTENNKLIGFTRGFSDDVLCTWIAEIVIAKEKQKCGFGSLLILEVVKRYKHTAIYAETLKGKEKFFEKHGIMERPKMSVVIRSSEK